jgi:hypothetical protein
VPRAAPSCCLIPPSQQSQHESSLLPLSFSSVSPAAWLIRPARIIPCGFPPPEGRPKLAPFFPSSTDSEPPADSAQSSHHRSRSRILLVPPGDGVQASAPRLAIFSPFSSPFDSALARTDLCFLTCFGGFVGTLRTNWLLFPFSSAWNRAQGTRVSPCVQS